MSYKREYKIISDVDLKKVEDEINRLLIDQEENVPSCFRQLPDWRLHGDLIVVVVGGIPRYTQAMLRG